MKVTFQIEGATPVSIECNAGDNLLELARRANVAIDAPCSGNGSCGKCRVKLVEGDVESIPSRHITSEEYEAGWRLSCNSKVVSDCTVFVPDIASAYQSRMKTADLYTPEEVAIFENAKNQATMRTQAALSKTCDTEGTCKRYSHLCRRSAQSRLQRTYDCSGV